jgi:CRISPR-associated protein Cmr4
MALDPIHVGTGGSRLGRVDNTIVRDPVTRIPKVPGSSLAGVVRAYAAMAKGRYPRCAGQGLAGEGKGHCAEPDCPICTVFGFATGLDAGGGFAGLAAFSDMQVLLFPVPSASGPLWVTSPLALGHLSPQCLQPLEPLPDPAACYRLGDDLPETEAGYINLGWLMLPLQSGDELKFSDQDNGQDLPQDKNSDQSVPQKVRDILTKLKVDPRIRERVVLVSDQVFTQVVNSNLEVAPRWP